MRTTAWAAPLAAVLLAACTTTAWPLLERFVPKEKQIDVNVGPEWGWFGGKHVIKVPDEVRVRGGTGKIVWVLGADAANAGYRFGPEGIRFDYPAPGAPASCRSTLQPRDAFPKCQPRDDGRGFECSRGGKHTPGACFKYTISLQAVADSDGARPPEVPPKDPWIVSE